MCENGYCQASVVSILIVFSYALFQALLQLGFSYYLNEEAIFIKSFYALFLLNLQYDL